MALVSADLDERICNRRHLALGNSFWGEAKARPTFAKICDAHDSEHTAILLDLCRQAKDLIEGPLWNPEMVTEALDAMTDGLWIRMHITPGIIDNAGGRKLVSRFLATVMPSRRSQIMERATDTAKAKSN